MSKKSYEPIASDFKNINVPDINIDLEDPNSYSNRVLPEKESRRRILTHSRMVGCEREMLLLFSKYDKLMRNCPSEKERLDMAKLANLEVFKLLGGVGELYVDGQLVYRDKQ